MQSAPYLRRTAIIIYRVTRDDQVTDFNTTLAFAHLAAKDKAKGFYDLMRIDALNVPTDKASLVDIFNDITQLTVRATPGRTWALSSRGGLREVKPGE